MSITEQTRWEGFELVEGKRFKLYPAIIKTLKENSKGLTARELASVLYSMGITKTDARQAVAPRCTELTDSGILKVIGKRKDSITGVNVAVYCLSPEAMVKLED